MPFQRLVVHVGAPKTASTAIQRGLFANRELLARHGVYLPQAGRLELEPKAFAHHHLGWELFSPERFDRRFGGWAELREELAGVDAETVVLSSEELSRLIWSGKRELLEERMLELCDDVTVVVCVRDQLSMLNSYYTQRVKMLNVLAPFPVFVERFVESGKFDLDRNFGPWYDSDRLKLRAIPFGPAGVTHPLEGVIAAAGVAVADPLDLDPGTVNPSLGPIGVEAAHLLSRYLTGRFPDFVFSSPQGRQLHRIAGRQAFERGWCEQRYWGFPGRLAEETAAAFAASNDRFARATWGTDWPITVPVERPQQVAQLEDLDPPTVEQVHQYVFAMASRWTNLVSGKEGKR